MKQVISYGANSTPGNTGGVTSFPGELNTNAAITSNTPWAVDGTFRNLRIRLTNAPGVGASWTVTVYKNDVASSLAVTIADTATDATDSTNTCAVTPGDTLTLVWTVTGTPAAPGDVVYSVEFDSTTAYESGYSQKGNGLNDVSARHAGIFWPCQTSQNSWSSIAGGDLENVVPTNGTLTALYVRIDGTPGTGKSYAFNVYKNGVKQDGTGGTVDTTVTIADSNTTGNATFSLALVAGDRVYLASTPSGSPAGRACAFGVRFVADTNGESIVGGFSFNDLYNGDSRFHRLTGRSTNATLESGVELIGNPTSYSLGKFYARSYITPSSGDTWTVTVRKNSASSALEAVITDAINPASDLVDGVTIDNADTFAIQVAPAGGPTSSRGTWSAVQTIASTLVGSSILGEDGTIAGLSRVHLLNLDGVTRTVSDAALEGSVIVGGNLTVLEQTSPPTGVAGAVRIWAEDNGSGKLRLMAQFPTGSAQQLAIEP